MLQYGKHLKKYSRRLRKEMTAAERVLRLANVNEAGEFWSERTKQASELAKIDRASDEVLATNIDRVRDQLKWLAPQAGSRKNWESIRFMISPLSKRPTKKSARADGIRCVTNM